MRIFLTVVAVAVLASACAARSPRPETVPPLPTGPLVAGPDELDRFWRLIEASARHSDDLDVREEWLTASLEKLSVKEIVEFEETRARVKARADTWLMWEACEVIQGWSSDDVFWYFQDWLISLGREVYERVTASPEALAEVPAVQALVEEDGAEWEGLSYVASTALKKKTGEDTMDELVSFEIPVNPDPVGERPAEDENRFRGLRSIFGDEDRLLG